MKKVLITGLIATSLLLTSCGNETNEVDTTKDTASNTKIETPITGKGSTVKEDTNTVAENTDTTKKEEIKKEDIPEVYIAFANDAFKKDSKDKDLTYNIFIDDDSELAQGAKEYFKNNKEITVTNPKTGDVQTREVFEYAPIHFFKVDTPAFDFKLIEKENPSIVHTIKTKDGEFFMFTYPVLGKEYIIFDDKTIDKINSKLMTVVHDKENAKEVILVEDLLNPASATNILSDRFKEVVKKDNVSILWIPNVSKTNTNALKLIKFVGLNNLDGKLNMPLVNAILEKQKDLKVLNITDGTNIKEILKTSSYKDSVDSLKTGDLDGTDYYNEKEITDIAANYIGVETIPSAFQIENNKLSIYDGKELDQK